MQLKLHVCIRFDATATVHHAVIHSIWPRVGSLTGGTKVTVYGSGFSTDAYNSVNLIYFGNIPCSVIS